MKIISALKYIFSFIGIALLAGAMMLNNSTTTFLESAIAVPGSVVDLVSVRSENSITFKPVVEFATRDGQKVEFTSSMSSNPPPYSVGEAVEVLYLPVDVQNAKINNYAELWASYWVTLVLGIAFSFVGGLMVTVSLLRKRRKNRLQRTGVAIEAKFQSVAANHSVSINGRNPFVIVCQWLDPVSGELHLFESENIWFDPSGFIKSDTLKVWIQRNNPKKHHVDVSFLPKLKS
jgi:hypothetical protein